MDLDAARLSDAPRASSRFPTRKELDAAAPQHPVVVDGAYAFALNSAALAGGRHRRATPPIRPAAPS